MINLDFLKLAIILLIIIGIIDIAYLSIFGKFFNNAIIKLQGSKLKIKYIPAILCYLLLMFIIYYFIISKNAKPREAFILGICIYGVYELTNYAILNNWPLEMVFLDTIWGGILFFLTTVCYYKINKKLIL